MHRKRVDVTKRHPVHVILKVRSGLPNLRQKRVVREVEKTWRRGAERGDFRLVHYSVQSNHVHLIVETDDAKALGSGMKSISARFALAVNRVLGRSGPVLRRCFHHVVLVNPTQVRNALRYVLLNVRKHAPDARGALAIDFASSGRWFDGWRGVVVTAEDPPVVATPRSWFLKRGWRKAAQGEIALSEVPA